MVSLSDSSSAAAMPSTVPFAALGVAGKPCLLVASTGGHLAQLQRLVPRLGVDPSSRFMTFPSPQADHLAVDHDVVCVPYIAPRDVKGVVTAARDFRRELASGRWAAVISTGSAIALSSLPQARFHGVPAFYIESYSRFTGPSVTGRLLARTPGVTTFTQHPEWQDRTWGYAGCVFDAVKVPDIPIRATSTGPVFVTLGTIRPYRFDALVDQLLAVLPPGTDVVWQLGATTRDDLPGDVRTQMSAVEFRDVARNAGTIVSHAGTGTALDLIEMGHKPVLVPRRASRGEHVDDHQLQIAHDLGTRDLVTVREVEELSGTDFAALAA